MRLFMEQQCKSGLIEAVHGTLLDLLEATLAELDDPAASALGWRKLGMAFQDIGEAEKAKNAFRHALKWTQLIENEDEKTRSLTEFGRELSNLGLQTFAKRVLRQATEAADGIASTDFRILTLAAIGQVQAEAMLFEEIVETERLLAQTRDEAEEDEDRDAVNLAERELAILCGLRDGENFVLAAKMARKLRDPWHKFEALRRLAEIGHKGETD